MPSVSIEADAPALRAAVEAVLTEKSPKLRSSAGARGAGGYFQDLLELGYLVASADGLADEERSTLAALIEHATDAAVDKDALLLHFQDLGATSDILGRSERIARLAANLEEDDARREAIQFAALVAIADGKMDESELDVLVRLGTHLDMSKDAIQELVDEVVTALRDRVGGAQ